MFEKKLSEESLEQEQSITPSELNSEKNIKTPSLPEEKHTSKRIWFWLVGTILFLLAIVYLVLAFSPREVSIINTPTYKGDVIPAAISRQVANSEGTLQINEEESLLFSSGAILKLENNILSFLYNDDVPWQEALSFDNKLTAYVNGHLHSFEDVVCDEEDRWFDDYSDSVVTQCRMNYSVEVSVKPILSSYDGEVVEFSSVEDKSISRFRTLQEEPWIAISVPYFQIAKDANRVNDTGVNVVSPRENVVAIYTNYGRADFRFNEEELNSREKKIITKGALDISLTPQKLSCGGNYVLSDGSCYTLEFEDSKYTTYNVVDFQIIIEEKVSSSNYPLLIDIEK